MFKTKLIIVIQNNKIFQLMNLTYSYYSENILKTKYNVENKQHFNKV